MWSAKLNLFSKGIFEVLDYFVEPLMALRKMHIMLWTSNAGLILSHPESGLIQPISDSHVKDTVRVITVGTPYMKFSFRFDYFLSHVFGWEK